jgi:hypothetical protein
VAAFVLDSRKERGLPARVTFLKQLRQVAGEKLETKMKAILGAVMALALVAPSFAGAGPGLVAADRGGSPIIRVAGGCGPDFHRNPEGYCRPNRWERERDRRYERLECPRGYHLGPEGRRCWPN